MLYNFFILGTASMWSVNMILQCGYAYKALGLQNYAESNTD